MANRRVRRYGVVRVRVGVRGRGRVRGRVKVRVRVRPLVWHTGGCGGME